MRRLLAGWDRLDPQLARVLRIDSALLAVAALVLLLVWATGLRQPLVTAMLVVVAMSAVLMLASAPLTWRFGPGAATAVLAAIGLVIALTGTWLAPHLSPLFTLMSVMPLLVLYPHVGRRWGRVLAFGTVLGSAAVPALGELVRPDHVGQSAEALALQVGLALPLLVIVVVLRTRDTFSQLSAQSRQLMESRADAVKIADAARRGIERDLHDGAQQQLVAMSLRITRARHELARGDLESLDRTLAELGGDALTAVAEVRELARGIYPALLAEKGLVTAIQSAARRSSIPVTVEAEDIGRRGSEVENAAYFCILEALNNAIKHGKATQIAVRLRDRERLQISVVDDGVGFDPLTVHRGGLLGMEARIQSAGGWLKVASTPGRGTTLSAELPTRPGAV